MQKGNQKSSQSLPTTLFIKTYRQSAFLLYKIDIVVITVWVVVVAVGGGVCVCVCMRMHTSTSMCILSIIWVLGIKFRSSDLVASTLACCAVSWPSNISILRSEVILFFNKNTIRIKSYQARVLME